MKYSGIVTKAGLKDEGFLNFAEDLREEGGYLLFMVDQEFAPAIISEMKEALRTGAYYGVVKSDLDINIIFAEKVATCKLSDAECLEKAIKYGASLGISEEELKMAQE